MDIERVVALARQAVMESTPYPSAWEWGFDANGEDVHAALREALAISYEEWRDSPAR